MNQQLETGQGATSGFQPVGWLDALTAIGGGYALMADRRLTFLVDDCDDGPLSVLMSHIIGQPDRHEAIKSAIELRRAGEVAA